jgi:hypothetical protein
VAWPWWGCGAGSARRCLGPTFSVRGRCGTRAIRSGRVGSQSSPGRGWTGCWGGVCRPERAGASRLSAARQARALPGGRLMSAALQPRSKRPADCLSMAFKDMPIAPSAGPLTTPRTPKPFLSWHWVLHRRS